MMVNRMPKSASRTVIRLGFGVAGLMVCVAALAVNDCELNGESVNPNHGAMTRGKTGVLRCKDRDTGALQREQELRDGEYIGLERFYRNGKLVREHSINSRGNKQGVAKEFAPDGQLLLESEYNDGSTVGIERRFHLSGGLHKVSFHVQPGGQKAAAEFTERGQLKSLQCAERPMLAPIVEDARLCGFASPSQLEFFRENGQLEARARYESGKRMRYEALHENGKPALEDEVIGDRRFERRFGSDGIKRRETEFRLLERGTRRERELEYSAAGTLTRERRWDERELTQEYEFYLNGQPRRKTEYAVSTNARTAEISDFHDNGKLARTGRYLTSNRAGLVAVGTHQRFHPNGQPASESVYDAQGRIHRERSFDEDGRLVRDDEVFEDGSRKAYAR
jgi:antitoxin component YwqK of YwqJK toxin-antitoxin module